MKHRYLVLIAGVAVTGAVWSSHAGANTVGGGFWRTFPGDGSYSSGCATAVDGTKEVDFDANLNIWGSNINVAPFSGCTRVEDSHITELRTWCYDGNFYDDSDSGNAGQTIAADILHLCDSFAGGGELTYFKLTN